MILAVQDTTIFNFTLHRRTEGLGPIGQAGLSGFFRHRCLAVSTEGVRRESWPIGYGCVRRKERTAGKHTRNALWTIVYENTATLLVGLFPDLTIDLRQVFPAS